MGNECTPTKDLDLYKQSEAQKMSAQPVKVCGYLKKRNRKHGILGSKWNKRWFVLEKGILTYAKSKQEIVKGEIQVFSMHELEYVCQKKQRLEFELNFPERELHLQALCKDDVRKWLEAFENSKRTVGVARAQQHSPTSPLDMDCSDLPGFRARSQTSRDCKSAGASSSSKKEKTSPRSMLANPSLGRRCFGNYFDDFETDVLSSTGTYQNSAEPKSLNRTETTGDACIEEFSAGLSESPIQGMPDIQEQQVEDNDGFGFKPFTRALDEQSDEGWLEEDWDNSEGEGDQGAAKELSTRKSFTLNFDEDKQQEAPTHLKLFENRDSTTTPVVYISPMSSPVSKSGSITSNKESLLPCDIKAVKYDSQIVLPELEQVGDRIEITQARDVTLDDINPDENWLEDEWDD
jgi:hypothetical protein